MNSNFIKYCTTKSTGTSNSHKRVDPDVMANYRVFINSSIVESFGKLISPYVQQYKNNQVEIRKTIEIRDFLLPLLMNGQVEYK
jgi:type I restriction enzyme S subunit